SLETHRPPRALPRGYFLGALTTSRLRPFARRRLRTLRPALVALRLRNPCSRLRRTLLGWYVRFTTTGLLRAKSAARKHAPSGKSRNLDWGARSFDPQRKFHLD